MLNQNKTKLEFNVKTILMSIYKIHFSFRCIRVHFTVLKPMILLRVTRPPGYNMLHFIQCLNYTLCMHLYLYYVFCRIIYCTYKNNIELDLYNILTLHILTDTRERIYMPRIIHVCQLDIDR